MGNLAARETVMLQGFFDQREFTIALSGAERHRLVRACVIAVAAGFFAFTGAPILAPIWAVAALGGEAALWLICQQRNGDEAETRARTAFQIIALFGIGVIWALAVPVLGAHEDRMLRFVLLLAVVGMLFYANLVLYRSMVAYTAVFAPCSLVLILLPVQWALARDGDIGRTAAISVVFLAVQSFVFGYIAMRRRASERGREEIERDAQEQAEAAIQASARLNFALDAFGAAIWEIDFVRQVIAGGDKIGGLMGSTEVTYDSFINPTRGNIHPEDSELVREAFTRSIANASALEIEHRVNHPSGEVRWLRTVGFPITSRKGLVKHLVLMSTDETARKRIETEFSEAMRKAETGLVEQRHMIERISDDLGLEHPALMAPAEAEPDTAAEANASIARFQKLSARLARLLAEIDVRDHALSDAMAAMERARDAAESANVAKSQFLANMSHELRTPLNAVIGYAEILEEDLDDEGLEAQARDAGRIRTAAKNLLALINEILDLSKIESGKMTAEAVDVRFAETVEQTLDLIRPLADKNNNTLVIDVDALLGTGVTDDGKLRQCLLNLMSNACKFTQNGTVTLKASRIAEDSGHIIRFDISDTGIGIDAEQAEKLFQPFVQADASTTRKFGGTGLGLVITRRIAQLLGGDVTFDSTPGQGSTFHLTVRAVLTEERARITPDAHTPTVVIVEDDPSDREFIRNAATRLGFASVAAMTAGEGASLVKDLKPQLVVLDICLPDIEGWNVLKALKANSGTAEIPVIVFTRAGNRARAIEAGACEHFEKPISADVLCAAMARFALAPPGAMDTLATETLTPRDRLTASRTWGG